MKLLRTANKNNGENMPFVIKEIITQEDKDELLTGLRAYNRQFVDTTDWCDVCVYLRDEQDVMRGCRFNLSMQHPFQLSLSVF
ncbi:hypothetical protein FHC49_20625 [Kluyvera sp. EC_51]|uniref:hypothetical protein n=1 Tax=Kluyvera sp. EC_51 TaxID=2584089 RepID=UPI001C707A83|nr:hypothetical protein [Kluyvera sp. EC_51]MBW9463728.1 hypothetical protein [Kluyvera sp. EC_51]